LSLSFLKRKVAALRAIYRTALSKNKNPTFLLVHPAIFNQPPAKA
jgi:hypothetical protein